MGEEDRERRLATSLGRALRLRCPACGARGILESWFGDPGSCPRCGLRGDRGEADYFLGPLMLNLVLTETLAAAVVTAALVLTLPHPPWRALLAGGLALVVLLPAAGIPFARLLWLAVDLQIRPPGQER